MKRVRRIATLALLLILMATTTAWAQSKVEALGSASKNGALTSKRKSKLIATATALAVGGVSDTKIERTVSQPSGEGIAYRYTGDKTNAPGMIRSVSQAIRPSGDGVAYRYTGDKTNMAGVLGSVNHQVSQPSGEGIAYRYTGDKTNMAGALSGGASHAGVQREYKISEALQKVYKGGKGASLQKVYKGSAAETISKLPKL